MAVYSDYGISADEPIERFSSLINYSHVMERLLISSDNHYANDISRNTPYLMEWHDRYYGVTLQMITVFFEHLRGFQMSNRDIFLLRHAFTFINYFIAAVFFYLILRRRFGDTLIPIMGALFFILYPRFFGESFFNIKDILFFSWCVIASYFTLRWLEDDKKESFIFPAAITLAVATNTRILGISILMLACGFAILQGAIVTIKGADPALKHNIKKSFHLILITFASYVVITPFLWENPLKNTIDTFFHFLRFPNWNLTHFYMGEMITREVPWHYIPVWMGITIPLLYIVMFLIGFFTIIYIGLKKRVANFYDLFFFVMFTCILLGFILLGINMYEGWRHVYMIFLPFLYVAVYGLYKVYKLFEKARKITKGGFIGVVSAYMLYLLIWIVVNHPYQYVYFNIIGRQFAERNFTLDYWYVSATDLAKHALNDSDEPFVRIAGGHRFMYLLTEEEYDRVVFTEANVADFYLRGSRLHYEWRIRETPPGFVEEKVIEVNGMRIATLFARELPFSINLDSDIWDKIVRINSSVSHNFHYLSDRSPHTRWNTGRPQQLGDYLMFEFGEATHFNYIYLDQGRMSYDFPRDLAIYTSMDGHTWENAPIQASASERHFVFESEEFYFIKLITTGYSEYNWWSIININFGHATME